MSLLDIRLRFRKFSGRFDLVDSDGNALDTLTDKFINDGQRFLDSLQRTTGSVSRKVERILQGDYKMPIKNLRAVKEVWVSDDESRTRLKKVELAALRETYDNAVETLSSLGDNLITNGNFSTLDGTGWTTTSGSWLFSSGKAVHQTGNTDNLRQAYQDMAGNPILGRRYKLQVAITGFTAGTLTVDMGNENAQQVLTTSIGTSSTQYLYFICENFKDLVFTPSSDFDGTLDDITLQRYEPTLSGVDEARPLYYAINIPDMGPEQGPFLGLVDFDPDEYYDYQELHFNATNRGRYRSIVFMPPADQTYTMNIIGLFESPDLIDDTDESYWTNNFPNLLAQAAMRELEITYRNDAGVRAASNAIREELFQIDKDLAEEESAEINQMEG